MVAIDLISPWVLFSSRVLENAADYRSGFFVAGIIAISIAIVSWVRASRSLDKRLFATEPSRRQKILLLSGSVLADPELGAGLVSVLLGALSIVLVFGIGLMSVL
ncbi:hypothetical protein [Timonella senegalensis]|uniref:hypothetical protein n=1 Tax=Timonella senegalensis TaxID=1465825 RepID=UPI002FDEFF89